MDYTHLPDLPRKLLTRVIGECELNLPALCGVVIGLLSMIWGDKAGHNFVIDGLDIVWHAEMEGYPPEMKKTVKFVVILSIITKGLSYHLYVLSYILLLYSLWSAKRSWATPWLGLSLLRCIVIELLECFTGCAICSLYGELKPACLFFVTEKAIYLAFSMFLWFQIFEFYLTDALYDWFMKEAETCERFDSDTAVDEDVRRFEERLATRARQVLNMSPKELIAYEKGMRETLKETPQTSQNSTQTDEQRLQSYSFKDYSPLADDILKNDPLKRFPYITTCSSTTISNGFDDEFITELDTLVKDVPMGTKSVEVQTTIQIPSQLSINFQPSLDDSLSLSIDEL